MKKSKNLLIYVKNKEEANLASSFNLNYASGYLKNST